MSANSQNKIDKLRESLQEDATDLVETVQELVDDYSIKEVIDALSLVTEEDNLKMKLRDLL